ncbi:acetylornithine deacetylase [Mesobaculum littorinae]|uniref:Acetylornithine deacetylase n=1 Tax=Mesobaculum littorinae TaxID=2486419 RepID=A0A438AE36_9RHOB|nr:acetylornithine deacetylase [Mesobaculum littorinae]RVV96937.1 acetylornithine deacetylase [Mesobaculum littorinae]
MTTRLKPREILGKLVSFPTVSRDSNLDLVDWVEGYLADHGIASQRHWNEDRSKAALYASVGPEVPGGVVLSGHTDVVPVDGQDWSSDPFVLREGEGKLFGRGAVDMKGFDALAIDALVRGRGMSLARPIQIALSYDEEIGCEGAPPLIAAMADLPRAACAIIGEPSMMRPVTGHKGGIGFEVTVHGVEVHSSLLPQGVSAIMEAARLVQWANDRNAELAAAPPDAMAALFDPPFTTLHVGKIAGGTAHNITARECRFFIEMRCVPSDPVETWRDAFLAEVARVEAAMQAVRPEARIDVRPTFGVPALAPETDGAAEETVRRITGDNARHVVSYGTEAGHFQTAGYSSVVCGPGDIAQAHQADEFITIPQFEAGEAFMTDLLESLCR